MGRTSDAHLSPPPPPPPVVPEPARPPSISVSYRSRLKCALRGEIKFRLIRLCKGALVAAIRMRRVRLAVSQNARRRLQGQNAGLTWIYVAGTRSPRPGQWGRGVA